jgi:hypothetical protein
MSTYADPKDPALPATGFELDVARAALVVVDPQIDFLSPEGVSWPVFGASITENGTVAHIAELFKAAKAAGITVAVSPHYYYPSDHDWDFGGPLERLMHQINMFGRKDPSSFDGFEGSGADFLPEYKAHILGQRRTISSCSFASAACRRSSLPGWPPTFASSPIYGSSSSRASRLLWCVTRPLDHALLRETATWPPSSTTASWPTPYGRRTK